MGNYSDLENYSAPSVSSNSKADYSDLENYVPTVQQYSNPTPNMIPGLQNTIHPTAYTGSSALNTAWNGINQAGNTIGDFILGAGNEAGNTLANAFTKSGLGYIPQIKSSVGTAYDIGRFGGSPEVLGTALMPEVAAASAVDTIPIAIAKYLGRIGSGTAQTTALSSLDPNNNQSLGKLGAENLAGNTALESIPIAGAAISKAAAFLKPNDFMQGFMKQLGNGQTLENNAQSLAQDVKNAYFKNKGEGNDLYNSVFDDLRSAGNNNKWLDPQESSYNQIAPDVVGTYDRNLNKLQTQFSQDPNAFNAHLLQSQLGSRIRDFQKMDAKGNLDVANRSTMQGYQDAQNALQGDLDSFLAKQSPDLADKYKDATQNWVQNVVPYTENPKISQIAKGDITNPRSIAAVFKNPEEDIQKVVGDLGESANNKIIYSELGKYQNSSSPENLTSAFSKLDQQGLGSYITPDMSKNIDILNSRIGARNKAQSLAAGIGSLGLGHVLLGGIPLAPEAAGLAGGYAGHALTNLLPSSFGSLSKYLSPGYRPLGRIEIASYTGNQ